MSLLCGDRSVQILSTLYVIHLSRHRSRPSLQRRDSTYWTQTLVTLGWEKSWVRFKTMWNMLLLNYCSRALRPSQKRFCTTNLLDDDLSQPATNSSDAFRITALQKQDPTCVTRLKDYARDRNLGGTKSFTPSQGGGGHESFEGGRGGGGS